MRLPQSWFLPRSFDVLGKLCAQLAVVERSIESLHRWSHGTLPTPAAVRGLRSLALTEHAARRDLNNAVRDSFSTPLESEDLFELGERLGEIAEAVYALVRESELSKTGPDRCLVRLLDSLVDAMTPLVAGVRALPSGTSASYADSAIDRLSDAEHDYRAAIADLELESDLRRELRRRELYRRAEHLHGALLRVARRTWYSVYKAH